MRHRKYSRRDRGWGGAGWTDPIPTKPRTYGSFSHLPRGWSVLDIVGSLGSGMVHARFIRPDWTNEWAEVYHYFGHDPAMPT